MANNVFANMMELSCKAGAGKSICCFPDVCMTPPENPATPPGIPIPYPNTGMASDTSKGSRSVKITGKEVTLKNSSNFKRTMGDEAGCAAKKGVISSKNMGKAFFNAWSMDVKIEGKNAVRMLDLMTHNHGSPTNTLPWPFIDSVAIGADGKSTDPCHDEKKREETACADMYDGDDKTIGAKFDEYCAKAGLNKSYTSAFGGERQHQYGTDSSVAPKRLTAAEKAAAKRKIELEGNIFIDKLTSVEAYELAQADPCLKARRCRLVPYKTTGVDNKHDARCCGAQTGHHVVEGAFCRGKGTYQYDKAPCICTEGGSTHGSHGKMHAHQKTDVMTATNELKDKRTLPYSEVKELGVSAVQETFPMSECSEKCMKAQLDAFHTPAGIGEGTELEVHKCNTTGRTRRASRAAAAHSKHRGGMKRARSASSDQAQKKARDKSPPPPPPGGV